MRCANRFIAALGCLACAAVTVPGWAQAPANQILGVPFGGKLALSLCPLNTDKATRPCWIDRPFVHKPIGTRLGYVHLPNSDGRPKWAADAMFELTIDKVGSVQGIKVHTFSAEERHEIAQSIGMRFGVPIENQLNRPDVSWASWQSAEGHVSMRCQKECWIDFRTPSAQAALAAERDARAKKDAARPKAP